MALRDQLAERSGAFLEPGEQVRQVFLAQSGPSPLFVLLSYWIVLFAGLYVIVVVTDRAIVVLRASKLRPTTPKTLLMRLPRGNRLGPVSGLWGKIELDRRYWVHKRFHKDVDAAVADLAAMDAGPQAAPPNRPQP
jgi:hypothetical protein